ncbi:IQ calmodulin-binding motif family protein [Tritrichomonas foetus]|uniref:IQ calmodulin-binding motif family protein n=1 Tax=Tritrichomonas foetus TaxID=1144522 RepID=A0A1J4KWW9_9EUKA|nr:IQ calmodulin-binding motif family protein [Tritrichomonas foetus]|eukprot:OHT15376.1 IQ calmodulin-binding motif family protein [Tritrichomonas foetus]
MTSYSLKKLKKIKFVLNVFKMKRRRIPEKVTEEEEECYESPEQKRDRLELYAARKIQSVFRGYIYRYNCAHLDQQHFAARKIQKVWREHKIRQRLHNLREIIALIKITRLISDFRRRLGFRREIQRLQQFEPIIAFYPSKCITPDPPPKRRRGRGRRRGGGGASARASKSGGRKSGRKGKSGGAVSRSADIPEPMTAPSRSMTYSGSRGPRRKRKIFMELPPPWHSKDARRLSQSQQDELMYAQKNNLSWVRSEVMPSLMRKINSELDLRDELIEKNEKFRTRMVTKSFISAKPRTPTYMLESTPKSITFIRETGIYVLLTTTAVFYLKTMSFMDDQILKKDEFDIDSPLFDVAVFPRSGFIYGLDHNWCIRLLNGSTTVLKKKLHPEVMIPSTKHFLTFDSIGFLWVNLIPQRSNILCLDPLTLQVTIQVNIENMVQVHRCMRSNIRLIPLSMKEPVGFAGTFNGLSDVVLFSLDFGRSRHLRHPNMKETPLIRKSANKLFVWSDDKVIYVYEMGTSIDMIQLQGSFKVDCNPIDICSTIEPDLIYVSFEDCTVRVYLGGKSEHCLRLPENKMTRLEMTFADALLGKPTYTKSRPTFLTMLNHRFSSVPIHLDAWSMTPKLAILAATFSNSSVHTIWMFNNAQPVKCDEFDKFKVKDSIDIQVAIVSEFKSEESKMLKKRADFLDTFAFMAKFDVAANQGQLRNIFLPNPPAFSLTKLVNGYSLRSFFPFIPETPQGHFSSYEVFHYLKRSGILPTQISEFSNFLTRLVPQNIKRTLGAEGVFNIKIPVLTTGPYNAITNFMFADREISRIIDRINPLICLKETLSLFTISSASDKASDNKDVTTPRRWVSLYEKTELNRRLSALIALEDLVKHELMGRVQHNIDEAFTRNQYDRMVPVPPIDIHQHVNNNDTKNMLFSEQPNRNPLLDQRMHKSIYHSWSTKTLYSRDRNIAIDLRVLHIPTKIFLTSTVQLHFDLVKRVSISSKRITSEIYAVNDLDEESRIVTSEDSRSLPLSHYIIIHSYLGANSRLILAARSILSRILSVLYQLHKNGIILRTLIPDNILLNATNGTVSIGNVFDCQQAAGTGRPNYLPLPDHFSTYTNPFLPPEYYHEPPRKWTTAFDVWQFGILLLYLITGFLPKSYGAELMKHIDDEQRLKMRRVVIYGSSPLDDPPLYPKCNFFYDWLNGCEVIIQGDRASWVSGDGKCFITTDRQSVPSILELDHYHLLPYKNTKIKYDESRLFLEIITSCLQIDPEKRPTVEQLLRTIPFNQANQVGDILDQYMRQPDSAVFVNEFFTPTLDHMTDASFPFALGIISALIFHDEMADEDQSYSFPLDTRAAERVIKSLFDVRFMDRLVIFVLNRIERLITYKDVNPTVSFKDDAFNSFLHLLERFVAAVEHGQGSLLNHVDEVVMTLLALYAGNPRLRNTSESFLEHPIELFRLASSGSAAVFVFTHHHVKNIVSYALQQSSYILNALKRTTEHNDAYFSMFLNFGEKVFAFANAMVHSIEKQRANAIYVLLQVWGNGQLAHVARLFVDFRVPQMAIHCFLNAAAKVEGAHFINEALAAVRLKSYEPTFLILQNIVCQSTIYLHCAATIRSSGKEEMKNECLGLIRKIMFGDNATAVAQLVISDVFWSLAEQGKSPEIYSLLMEAICFSSKFVIQLIFSSQHLRKLLKSCDIDLNPHFDFDSLSKDSISIYETLETAKRLSATLFIRQSSLPIEVKSEKPPLELATTFLINSIKQALEESDRAAKNLDREVLQTTRFDLKGTTYLKAKTTARNTDFSDIQGLISEMCDVLLHLFRCICFYWREPGSNFPRHLINFVLDMITAPIPECQSMPHPAHLIHHCIQQMALHCLVDLPESSPVRLAMMAIQEIYPKVMLRDIMFVMHCIDKDIVEMQLISRYPKERQIRMKVFQTVMLDRQSTNLSPILRFVVSDMLHNRVQFNGDTVLSQNYPYPIRSEAINMIMFLFSVRDKHESAAKRLVDELLLSNFIEEERKLTDNDNDQQLSSSSIMFLRMVTQCPSLFEEKTMKPAKNLLETLCMRYTREWMNISAFNSSNDAAQANNKSKSGQSSGASTGRKSSQAAKSNIKVMKAQSIKGRTTSSITATSKSTLSPRTPPLRSSMKTARRTDTKIVKSRPNTAFSARRTGNI